MVSNIGALLGAALLLLVPAVAAAQTADFAALRERVLHPPPGHVIVVAHRACFSSAPENSPEAIDACAKLGVEVVENDESVDVREPVGARALHEGVVFLPFSPQMSAAVLARLAQVVRDEFSRQRS